MECKKLFQADIAEEVRAGSASNGIGGPEERGVDAGDTQEEAEQERIFEEVCGDGEGSECGGAGTSLRTPWLGWPRSI